MTVSEIRGRHFEFLWTDRLVASMASHSNATEL